MLYKDLLANWLTDKKIYLKYSTYTNYYNIIHTHLLPKLDEYDINMLDNDILQQLITYNHISQYFYCVTRLKLYVSRNKLLCTAAQYQ